MKNLKKLTILHSNDLHGDFTSDKIDDDLVGGISLLSGYVQKIRREEENVIYAIAGDMFCGSLIDSEFKGVSTIELMNMLTPDVATVGNHEVDYGIAHLLFLEKCARFPIINANLYIKNNYVRLFRSHTILNVGGIKVLFIGLLTKDVLAQTKQDTYLGSLVDVRDAAHEVGKICNSYQTEDIDFTVLLTHIGIDGDKELAKILDPAWGVDIIIGGHTHTMMEDPVIINGIPIVQASSGTDQIGRFDITVDTSRNAINSFRWQIIPIDDEHCPRDPAMERLLRRYEKATEEKYSRYVTRLANRYTHPARDRETELGKLFADILKDSLGLDIMMIGSGFLRATEMGPIVELKDILEMCPYDESITRVTMTGAQLKRAIHHIFRREALAEGAHAEFYQYSRGLSFVCHMEDATVTDILFEGQPIDDCRLFNIGLHQYHFANMAEFLSVSLDDTRQNKEPKVVSTGTRSVLEEWMSRRELVYAPTDSRWITVR